MSTLVVQTLDNWLLKSPAEERAFAGDPDDMRSSMSVLGDKTWRNRETVSGIIDNIWKDTTNSTTVNSQLTPIFRLLPIYSTLLAHYVSIFELNYFIIIDQIMIK